MHERAKVMHIEHKYESVGKVWKASQISMTFWRCSVHLWVELSSNKLTVIQLPFQCILKRINWISEAQDMFVLPKIARAEN